VPEVKIQPGLTWRSRRRRRLTGSTAAVPPARSVNAARISFCSPSIWAVLNSSVLLTVPGKCNSRCRNSTIRSPKVARPQSLVTSSPFSLARPTDLHGADDDLRGPARACSYYESLADDGFISSYTSQQARLGLAAWTWRSHSLNPLSSPSIVQSCKRVNKAVPTLLSSGISVTSLSLLISYYSNRTKILQTSFLNITGQHGLQHGAQGRR